MLSDSSNNKFKGWAGISRVDPLVEIELNFKQWDDDSVELNVTHCGVCGSDIHTLEEAEGPNNWPVVLGHEIVGVVTRIGKNVTTVKVGDRAGVGPQSAASCHSCEPSKGDRNYGGFADKWRGDYRQLFKIPENMSSEVAASLSCAGVTTYLHFQRTHVGSDSVVGVVGIGGIGHFGVLWAKAMGAQVIGLSHSNQKRIVAEKLGCDDYVDTSDEAQLAKYQKKFTHILFTSAGPDFEWCTYVSLLRQYGHFINVMLPDPNLPPLNSGQFNPAHVTIHGSLIGSPSDIKEAMEFAAEKRIRPWIQVYPMKDVNRAIDDFKARKPRFKIIMENQL